MKAAERKDKLTMINCPLKEGLTKGTFGLDLEG